MILRDLLITLYPILPKKSTPLRKKILFTGRLCRHFETPLPAKRRGNLAAETLTHTKSDTGVRFALLYDAIDEPATRMLNTIT